MASPTSPTSPTSAGYGQTVQIWWFFYFCKSSNQSWIYLWKIYFCPCLEVTKLNLVICTIQKIRPNDIIMVPFGLKICEPDILVFDWIICESPVSFLAIAPSLNNFIISFHQSSPVRIDSPSWVVLQITLGLIHLLQERLFKLKKITSNLCEDNPLRNALFLLP